MASVGFRPCLILVDGSVQEYAWGKVGRDSMVSKLKEAYGFEVDEEKTYAELWFGTHPNGPTVLHSNRMSLKEWLEEHPDHIGHPFMDKGLTDLPYLLKVLSVNKALSIQAHPDKKLAEKLHASFPDLYKDGNHKPELAYAITPFDALLGFRPLDEITEFLTQIPELRDLVGIEVVNAFTQDNRTEHAILDVSQFQYQGGCDSTRVTPQPRDIGGDSSTETDFPPITLQIEDHALRMLFRALTTAPSSRVSSCLASLISRVKNISENERSVTEKVVLKLADEFPGDVGIFAPFILNLVHLEPGEAIFCAANEPHAYLSGDCIECMALSDNVVRVGLTPKFKDVDTLCSMLTYKTEYPNIQRGSIVDDYARVYQVPVTEFELVAICIPLGHNYVIPCIDSASFLLVAVGEGEMEIADEVEKIGVESTCIRQGHCFFMSTFCSITIHATCLMQLYRIYCPSQA